MLTRFLKSLSVAYVAAIFCLASFAWTGCTGLGGRPKSAEELTFETLRDAQDTVKAALDIYVARAAKATVANDRTRESDPGGFLERQEALTKRQGKVQVAVSEFQAAVTAQRLAWLGKDGSDPANDSSITVNAATAAALNTALKALLSL